MRAHTHAQFERPRASLCGAADGVQSQSKGVIPRIVLLDCPWSFGNVTGIVFSRVLQYMIHIDVGPVLISCCESVRWRRRRRRKREIQCGILVVLG